MLRIIQRIMNVSLPEELSQIDTAIESQGTGTASLPMEVFQDNKPHAKLFGPQTVVIIYAQFRRQKILSVQ
jgi:hypothetical protein